MSLSVLSNIAALRAQRQLSETTARLSTVYERLSSGSRINSASDDAAGLAIADALRGRSRVATAAIRNVNDGISLISIADGALGSITNVLQRMAELAEQSANGVYRNTQRSALQNEFSALASEIERIANTTQFNSLNLLSGGSSIALQVGFDSGANSQITVAGVQGTLSAILLANSGSSQLTYSVISTSESDSQTAARTALQAVLAAIDNVASARGTIGAAESRLHSAVNNLQVARENFIAAESQIRDVDVAFETANLVREQVLQQAGIAILTQANLQPALVVRLLSSN